MRGHAGADRPPLAGRHRPGQAAARQRRRLGPLEVQAALDRCIRVIPVLVDRTPVPRRDQLPEPLAALAGRTKRVGAEPQPLPVSVRRQPTPDHGAGRAGDRRPGRRPDSPGGPIRRADTTRRARLSRQRAGRAVPGRLAGAVRGPRTRRGWCSSGDGRHLDPALHPRQAEPLTVAWVFPAQGGWYGRRCCVPRTQGMAKP